MTSAGAWNIYPKSPVASNRPTYIPFSMFKIAPLPSLHFTKQFEEKERFVILADVTVRPTSCPHCGHTVVSRHTKIRQRYCDSPSEGKQVFLLVTMQRYKCEAKRCEATFTPRLDEIHSSRMITKRLVAWLETEFRYSTDRRLFYLTGLHQSTLRELRNAHYDKLWATHQIRAPRVLGIDEVKLGGTFKTVFTNLDSTPHRVVDVLDSYSVASIVRHLRMMPGIDLVEYVCVDDKLLMKEVCRRALPDATPVLDRFHVCKVANEVFAGQIKHLNSGSATQAKRNQHLDQGSASNDRNKSLRTLLLKKGTTLKNDERRKVQRALEDNAHVQGAYQEKEAFYRVYECKTRHEALKTYRSWKGNLTPARRRVWGRLIQLIATHRIAFFSSFACQPEGLNNGFTEWVNQRLKEMNRDARSMSFAMLRSRAIFECHQITERSPGPRRDSFDNYTTGFMPPPVLRIEKLGISVEELFLPWAHPEESLDPT